MNAPLKPPVTDFVNEYSKVDPEIQVFSDCTYQHCPGGSKVFQALVNNQYGQHFDAVAWFPDNLLQVWTRLLARIRQS